VLLAKDKSRTHISDFSSPSVSSAVTDEKNNDHPESRMDKGFWRELTRVVKTRKWCALQGSNLRLLACEASALPLS
jgi:hypothetical protein